MAETMAEIDAWYKAEFRALQEELGTTYPTFMQTLPLSEQYKTRVVASQRLEVAEQTAEQRAERVREQAAAMEALAAAKAVEIEARRAQQGTAADVQHALDAFTGHAPAPLAADPMRGPAKW